MVDTAGNVDNHVIYDAFGLVVSQTNSLVVVSQGYTGRWHDTATGLQYNHHRWYDPATGEWASEDPIGFDGGDANLGRYVGNTPTMYNDPSGLSYTFNAVPGERNGKKGVWIHKYDNGAWYDLWASPQFVNSAFIQLDPTTTALVRPPAAPG